MHRWHDGNWAKFNAGKGEKLWTDPKTSHSERNFVFFPVRNGANRKVEYRQCAMEGWNLTNYFLSQGISYCCLNRCLSGRPEKTFCTKPNMGKNCRKSGSGLDRQLAPRSGPIVIWAWLTTLVARHKWTCNILKEMHNA